MMKNRLLMLVALVCMAMGMAAQDMTTAQQDSLKKVGEEYYKKGNAFWKDKDVDKALTYYGMAAEAGNAEAQYLLALLCIEGKKMVQDYEKAVEWLEKAAVQGHKDAQKSLASIYYQGKIVQKDLEKAQYWALKYKQE
ncbi:MAG: sel1 repeat family protein [Bacteroidaceae bacterium]|nr:sel1 repeat family protein [Bacteroidaceae bacterium]